MNGYEYSLIALPVWNTILQKSKQLQYLPESQEVDKSKHFPELENMNIGIKSRAIYGTILHPFDCTIEEKELSLKPISVLGTENIERPLDKSVYLVL